MHVLYHLKAAVLAAGVLLLAAAPAQAEWRRAESANFIIYSQGSESSLRRQARTLEMYDYILRARMGLPLDEPPARKLPIYMVGGRSGLREIRPDLQPHVAGFYSPATEGIFATAIRDQDMDFLLHEYFHHFSFQHSSAGHLPGWLVEGFAEYFMTADVQDNTIRIGEFNQNRAEWLLTASWIPLADLLGKRMGEIRAGSHRDTYYPVAWLLTHWFMNDEARRAQLGAYITAVGQGGDPVRAMEEATGLTLAELRRRLQSYMRGALQISVYEVTRAEPEITVTRLPRSADDLLLLGQRLKVGVPDDQRAATAALVRQRAGRHPDDPFALLQLGHAELHFGDPVVGEAVLTRLLEREPQNVEALQLMASRYMRLARDEAEDRNRRLVQAQGYLRRAYAADPEQYHTLFMLAQVREAARDYPNENDLLTWRLAYERAPQLPGVRLGFASAMMHAERFDEAVALLEPLANAPHGGGAMEAARALLERAKARQSPMSWEEIDAAQDAAARPPEPAPTDPSTAPSGDEDASGEDET